MCARQQAGLFWEKKGSGEAKEARGLCPQEIGMKMNYFRRTEKTPMRTRKEGRFKLRGQHEEKKKKKGRDKNIWCIPETAAA